MIILLMLEYIWEEPWLNTREVTRTAHVTVGPPKKRFWVYRCSLLPLTTNRNKQLTLFWTDGGKGEDDP